MGLTGAGHGLHLAVLAGLDVELLAGDDPTLLNGAQMTTSLPAVLTGFLAPVVGLRLAADVYGAAVILMALASLVAISACGDARFPRLDPRRPGETVR